jgi:hypothetical protein
LPGHQAPGKRVEAKLDVLLRHATRRQGGGPALGRGRLEDSLRTAIQAKLVADLVKPGRVAEGLEEALGVSLGSGERCPGKHGGKDRRRRHLLHVRVSLRY